MDPLKIREILSNLPSKSGPGPDGIPLHCLKYGGNTVITAVTDIGREMFYCGWIPDVMKETWITPVWKGSNKEEPSDYQPIAIMNHLIKVLEQIVRLQLVDYLTQNGLLDKEQHGGHAFRSTLIQLLDQNDWIVDQLGEGSNIDLQYLDFAKAFDLVDLSILVQKLNVASIGGKALDWILSFLSNRQKRVRVENSLFEKKEVRSRVPHGSVLGPVLFLVYIADLQLTNPGAHSKLLKFVDDSKVMSRINVEENVAKLQEDLVAIYNWAGQNHMRWKDLKFQVLRLGPCEEIIENTTLFSPHYGEVEEAKCVIKDLEI